MNNGKNYIVELFVGNISLGTYEVHNCNNEQEAYESAWEMAEMHFYAETVKEF